MDILYSTSNSNQWSSQNTEHWDIGIEGDVSLAKTIKVIKISYTREVSYSPTPFPSSLVTIL